MHHDGIAAIVWTDKEESMAKKKKSGKKQDMPEFSFKEFTAEESAVYEEALNKFREAVAAGRTLRQAYESYSIADAELRALIQADFLKILIAERHFAGRQPMEKIAKDLDIALDLLMDTHARMLQEVGVSAAEQFSKEHGGLAPSTDD